jgi:hypothetical protein
MNAVVDFDPSIVSRMPADEYHSMPGISISSLKPLSRSPLHYRYQRMNPRKSDPMTLGTAAHCAVLEPHLYESRFAVWSRLSDSGNACPRRGQFWDAFVLANSGKEVLTTEQHELAQAMGRAVRADPIAMKYLSFGEPEVTMRWSLNDRACRGRADWITKIDDEPVIVGLKTARDCRPFQFGAQEASLGYHMQHAFYHDGYVAITGTLPRLVEIVVETAPPHAVVVYRIPADIIDQGRDDYMNLLNILDACERTNEWPGPGNGMEMELTMPSWAYPGTDDIGDIGLETE